MRTRWFIKQFQAYTKMKEPNITVVLMCEKPSTFVIVGKHKGLLIAHLNIRSLWIKVDLVKTTFDKSETDIITFSEANEIPNY